MTAWRAPARQAENTESGTDHGATKGAADRRRPAGLAGKIRQLFWDAKQALTGKHVPAPEPQKRRRKEETRGAFRLAAGRIMRRVRSMFHGDDFDWWPPGEMDDAQRQQWHWNDQARFDEMTSFHASPNPSNYLFPHL